MLGQPIDSAKFIVDTVIPDLFKTKNKAQRLKLVKLIIEVYVDYIGEKLVNGEQVVLTNVGKLIPLDFNIGAKNNPFTGEFMQKQTVKRIKFIPSVNLKRRLRSKR
ncbi:MAG: HU family DNA-binding protein [Candidatus Pacebacteria bacterium]|nr:HU family DNA-binding protein [Candidatus Paceibacterota bacterium]